MKKILMVLLAASIFLTGCSSSYYRTYYSDGQIQSEQQESIIGGTLNGLLIFTVGVVGAVFGNCHSHHHHHHYCPHEYRPYHHYRH